MPFENIDSLEQLVAQARPLPPKKGCLVMSIWLSISALPISYWLLLSYLHHSIFLIKKIIVFV